MNRKKESPACAASCPGSTLPRVLIADDHPVFRTGLRDIVAQDDQFRVVGEAGDGNEALRLIHELRPEIVILDIEMPHLTGLEVAQRIFDEQFPVSVLILTMHQSEAIFNRAINYGVTGYLLKDSAAEDILEGLRAVARGKFFVSPALIRHTGSRNSLEEEVAGLLRTLSPAELNVLALIADSRSTKDIADQLCISPRTVDNHRSHIAQKLQLRGRYSLLRFALAHVSQVQREARK